MVASPYVRYLPALGMFALSGILVGAVLLLIGFLNDKPQAPVRIQQISLLPSLPPPVEKPPEPEIKKEMPPMEAPRDAMTDASDPIATENTSGNGPAISFGKASAGIGTPFGSYSADLTADIRDWFVQDRKLRGERYSVVLRLWIARSGRIERAELASTTGIATLDQRLRSTLVGFIGKVREAPPQEMPQPVRLSVRSQT